MSYKKGDLSPVYREVGEYIYETLIVFGPTDHSLLAFAWDLRPGGDSIVSYLLETQFSNIGAHHV